MRMISPLKIAAGAIAAGSNFRSDPRRPRRSYRPTSPSEALQPAAGRKLTPMGGRNAAKEG